MRNLEKKKKKKKREKMGRSPCCDKEAVKKGAWTPEEDKILVDYINKNGHGTWRSLPKFAESTYKLFRGRNSDLITWRRR